MKITPILKETCSSFFPFFLLVHLVLGADVISCNQSGKIFPEITGWKKSKRVQIYSPENLYEYINGAAELYLSYNCQELQVAEYYDKNNASVVIEIYRHKTSTYAFGIYGQERPRRGDFLNIGTQGYFREPILNFLSGNYYVKISSYDIETNNQEILQTFAEKIAKNLGDKVPLPKILSCFPEKRKKQNSEKFIAENFLGYEFLHSGFTADYSDSNTTFKLFIIEEKTSQNCEHLLRQYMQFTKHPQKDLKEGYYTLSDPYHGEISLSWKGKYIWGVLNYDQGNLQLEYLKLTEVCLQKQELIE